MSKEFDDIFLDDKIKQLLIYVSEFYMAIKTKEIYFGENKENADLKKAEFSFCLSLLYIDSEVKSLFNKLNITYENILNVYGIDKIKLEAPKLEDEDISNILSNDFIKDFLSLSTQNKNLTLFSFTKTFLDYSKENQDSILIDYYKKTSKELKPSVSLEDLCDIIDLICDSLLEQKYKALETEARKKTSVKKNSIKFKSKYLSLVTSDNFDYAYGRDEEIKKLIISLILPNKSAIIVGPSGTGKTSLVKGLAYRINSNMVPEIFKNKTIVSLDVAGLVSGCKYVGMFEERLTECLKELEKEEDVLVFIDEIHTIVGTGRSMDKANDMANILKPYLDDGKIKVIGATTNEEYEKYIKPDKALTRRFEIIGVKEPNVESLKGICSNVIERLTGQMQILFLDNDYEIEYVIDLLLDLTSDKNRVYNDKVNNPDLVISIISRAFALAKYYNKNVVDYYDIIEAINQSERIYDFARVRTIKKLKTLLPNEIKENDKKLTKGKIINFSNLR